MVSYPKCVSKIEIGEIKMSKKLEKLIEKANSGDVVALVELAQAYFKGEVNGYPESGKGMECVEKAARLGSPSVQNFCASLYKELGLHKKAFEWYMEAAKQNHPESQALVASYYFSGEGVDKDDKRAFEWAQKAHENGEKNVAPTLLGGMYIQGTVVESSYSKAYELFCIGAKNGNELAIQYKKQLEDLVKGSL